MEHIGLSLVGLFQLQIVVGSGLNILHMLHIIVDSLQHMMAGGTDGDQFLSFFFGSLKCTDGCKLGCDLIAAQRIYTATALPVFDLFHLKSKSLRRSSCISVKISGFVLQSTARIITVFHSLMILSLSRKNNFTG